MPLTAATPTATRAPSPASANASTKALSTSPNPSGAIAAGNTALSSAPGNLLHQLRSALPGTITNNTAARTSNDLVSARTAVPSGEAVAALIGMQKHGSWNSLGLTNTPVNGLLLAAPGPVGNGYTINMTYTGCNRPPAKVKFLGKSVPLSYGVSGGGTLCPGEEGSFPVALEGSQPGIVYQLERNGQPVGTPLTGDGSPVDFGSYEAAGIYTVEATDRTSGCSKAMAGRAEIYVSTLKEVEAGPEGWYFEQAALVPLEGTSPEGGTFTGPGATSVHLNPANAGRGDHQLTYTCTDEYGCAASDTRQVHVMAAPVLQIEGPKMLKAGQTARLYTEAGYQQYAWYKNGKAVGTHSHELTTAEAGTNHVAVSQQGATISTNAIEHLPGRRGQRRSELHRRTHHPGGRDPG